MAESERIGAILIHPDGNFMGNIRWPGDLLAAPAAALPAGIAAIRERGYFASPFPEGDGITFNRQDGTPYEAEKGLADFRECFPLLDLTPLDREEGLTRALARLASGRTVSCCYLMPVEGLRLDEPIQLGETRFHPQVNGIDVRLADHAWRELCDVPGARCGCTRRGWCACAHHDTWEPVRPSSDSFIPPRALTAPAPSRRAAVTKTTGPPPGGPAVLIRATRRVRRATKSHARWRS